MELHLFSTPGEDDIRWVLDASRPFLENRTDPIVAYLPLASLFAEKWLEQTQKAFHGLAQIEMINTETTELPQMEAVLRRAAIVYVPGGNTFLLNHRLHISRLITYLKKKVQSGLPLVAFSAGTILCGPNILTSKDMNTVETPHFNGLDVTPFNFFVHYAEDAYLRAIHDDWLADYHIFHDNPVIIMADGSHIKIDGKKTQLVFGDAWLLHKGQEKEKIKLRELITL
ncbi:MAG TPA: Type 1 glutamine amidotransferase-like domain-containing protein [Anaerolineales bacterium]